MSQQTDLKLKCLELASKTYSHKDKIELARNMYDFLTEKEQSSFKQEELAVFLHDVWSEALDNLLNMTYQDPEGDTKMSKEVIRKIDNLRWADYKELPKPTKEKYRQYAKKFVEKIE